MPPDPYGDPFLAYDFDFASVNYPPLLANIERTSLGTEWQSDGTLGWGAHNALTRSQSLAAGWTVNTAVLTATDAFASDPWGETKAIKVLEGSGTGNHYIFQTTSKIAASQVFTAIVYVKAGVGTRRLQLAIAGSGGGSSRSTKFRASDGTMSDIGASSGSGFTHIASSMTLIANGWYRCRITVATDSDTTAALWAFFVNDAGQTNYAGDGASTLLLASFRLQRGAHDDDNRIETTTAARYLMRQELHPLLSSVGVLGEPQRRNRLTYSNDFTNGAWTVASAAAMAMNATGPDGIANSAATLIDDSGGGSAVLRLQQSVTVVSGVTNIFSVYAKADQLSWCALSTQNFDAPNLTSYFNLATAAKGTINHPDAFVESVGNGWVRCSVAFTTTTDTSGQVYIHCADGDGDNNVDRDGTSSILVYGAQVEDDGASGSALYPSSLIPTGSTTATRTADQRLTYTLPTALQTALATAGTLYVEFAFVGAGSSARTAGSNYTYPVYLHDGTNNNRVQIYTGSSGTMERFVVSGGVNQMTGQMRTAAAAIPAYTVTKQAVAWKANDGNSCIDGDLGAADSLLTPPVGLTTLDVLDSISVSTSDFGLIVLDVRVYTRRLSDTELQALTS